MKNNFEQISKVSGFMLHNGGLHFKNVSETEFEFRSTIQKIHLNRRKITHGGFICSLIDAGAGTAVYRASNNQSCVTISLDVKFIAPSRLGDEILGKVNILKKTKSMLFVSCSLYINKNVIASAIGVWKVIKKI
tara:strand:+ start:266 stop:667 length:402 start_codon:yes stop_codon:yes gene_type:complete